jgi:transcription antitermination factor NusG
MNQQTKNWYAVYTRPRWEKKVAKQLEQKKIETYCPLNKVERKWSDRKKIILEPLFTSYVFVRAGDEDHLSVRSTEGIVNFVYWLKKPAVIRDEEIEVVKRFMNEFQNVSLEKTFVNVNSRVKIINGPLMERQGNVLEIKNKTIKVWLPSLGYNMVVEIEKNNIEILSLSSSGSNLPVAL